MHNDIYDLQTTEIIPPIATNLFYFQQTRSANPPTSIGIICYVIRTRLEKISVRHDMFCHQEWPLRIIDGEIIPGRVYANYYYGSVYTSMISVCQLGRRISAIRWKRKRGSCECLCCTYTRVNYRNYCQQVTLFTWTLWAGLFKMLLHLRTSDYYHVNGTGFKDYLYLVYILNKAISKRLILKNI